MEASGSHVGRGHCKYHRISGKCGLEGGCELGGRQRAPSWRSLCVVLKTEFENNNKDDDDNNNRKHL